MKIVSLDVENIKRISAAFIAADGQSIVTIGGKNGHGKSSCLDAIAMAIGGKKLCPPEPLKRGQSEGHVTVDLGQYLITRKFWREDGDGPVKSSLTVSSPDGADYKSPQGLLDQLVSDLTFDPLAFLDLQPAAQREYVRQFVGLDFTKLDANRRAALEAVRECETVLKVAEHDVKAGEYYPDAPKEPLNADALLEQLAGAEQLSMTAALAEQEVEAKRRAYNVTVQAQKANEAAIADLERQLVEARELATQLEPVRRREMEDGRTLGQQAAEARAAVPDTNDLRARLATVTTINAQVQANRRHASLLDARDEARSQVKEAKQRIAAIDAEKRQQLEAASFPVPGLSFSDEGLMFDGLPFEQASYAQQLRVAVAMGLASNPALKVLLIKHGNALDKASMQLLAELAEEHGAQCWLERVSEGADGVSVLIDEGRVAAINGTVTDDIERCCVECGVLWNGIHRGCSCDAPPNIPVTKAEYDAAVLGVR